MFYEFGQNNSGGSFIEDVKRGISHYVIIEADSVDEANDRAEKIGLYFNGCDSGKDCRCCGDRWYTQYDNKEGTKHPEHYGKRLGEDFKDNYGGMMVWDDASHLFVHYKDGTIAGYKQKSEGFEFLEEFVAPI